MCFVCVCFIYVVCMFCVCACMCIVYRGVYIIKLTEKEVTIWEIARSGSWKRLEGGNGRGKWSQYSFKISSTTISTRTTLQIKLLYHFFHCLVIECLVMSGILKHTSIIPFSDFCLHTWFWDWAGMMTRIIDPLKLTHSASAAKSSSLTRTQPHDACYLLSKFQVMELGEFAHQVKSSCP